MGALYAEELRSIADYVGLVLRLRAVMEPHVAELLHAGLSVVLDWPEEGFDGAVYPVR